MDFGYPQYTEAKILSEFIKTDAYRMEVAQRPPMAVTNAVSWRSEGIRYKKNEVSLFYFNLPSSFLSSIVIFSSNWNATSVSDFVGILGCCGECQYTCQ